jgi:DNA-directed RNA polymerase subunit RPC12/RpoP
MTSTSTEKTQSFLERMAAEIVASPAYNTERMVDEVFGPSDDWVLDLGLYKLLLIPFSRQWWLFDTIHDEWVDTGYRAGEVTFSVENGMLLPPPPMPGARGRDPDAKQESIPAGLKCLRCGEEFPADKKFCTACGAPNPSHTQHQAQPQPVCTDCGLVLTPGKKFCSNCGRPVRALVPASPAAPQPPLVCPACSTPLSSGAKFCGQCGTKIS